MSYIVGNDGNATLGSGNNAHLSTWSATFTRNSSVITGYADAVARRRLGLLDATGSAAGHLKYNVSSSAPTTGILGTTNADGAALVLSVIGAGGSVGNGNCGYSITAVVSSVALSSDKNGDATVSFNWEASGSITEVWDETA